jgi:hypothetical protein
LGAVETLEQGDAHEFGRSFINRLECAIADPDALSVFHRIFRGRIRTRISCTEGLCVEKDELFFDASVATIGFSDLRQSLAHMVAEEAVTGENEHRFADGVSRKASLTKRITLTPELSCLHLKRFQYDPRTGLTMKDNSLFEFPDCLDTTSYLSDDAARHGSMIYCVYGVLVHSGEAMAGHYDAYLFSLDFNTWVKYNDSVVSAVDVAQVRADGFGGGERPRVSAYILVYIHEDFRHDLLYGTTGNPLQVSAASQTESDRNDLVTTRELRNHRWDPGNLYFEDGLPRASSSDYSDSTASVEPRANAAVRQVPSRRAHSRRRSPRCAQRGKSKEKKVPKKPIPEQISQIIDEKIYRGRHAFLVQWEESLEIDNSWVSERNMEKCDDLVKKYREECAQRKRAELEEIERLAEFNLRPVDPPLRDAITPRRQSTNAQQSNQKRVVRPFEEGEKIYMLTLQHLRRGTAEIARAVNRPLSSVATFLKVFQRRGTLTGARGRPKLDLSVQVVLCLGSTHSMV